MTRAPETVEITLDRVGVPETSLTLSTIALGTWAIGGWMWGGTDEAVERLDRFAQENYGRRVIHLALRGSRPRGFDDRPLGRAATGSTRTTRGPVPDSLKPECCTGRPQNVPDILHHFDPLWRL